MKTDYEKIALEWLKKHYPKEEDDVDPKWSAVINFAVYLNGEKEN